VTLFLWHCCCDTVVVTLLLCHCCFDTVVVTLFVTLLFSQMRDMYILICELFAKCTLSKTGTSRTLWACRQHVFENFCPISSKSNVKFSHENVGVVVTTIGVIFRFLWPCIVSKVWRERENQQDATIRCLLSTSVSVCFGHHYARNMLRQKLIINIWLLHLFGFFSLHTSIRVIYSIIV